MAMTSAFIAKKLRKNLPKLGDALVSSIYTKYSDQSADYNPETGITTDPEITFNLNIIYAKFASLLSRPDSGEIEGSSVVSGDIKGIVEQSFFPIGILPKKDDVITNLKTGIQYFLVGFNTDPYNVVYLLHLRPKEE